MKPHRLCLVTHIDWGHIWQRPQHLAVALGAHYDVTVISPLARRRGQLVANPARGITLRRVLRLPGSYRRAAIVRLNGALARAQCAPTLRRAGVVVVTSPELFPWVESGLGSRRLVYDCMDDALAFAQDPGVRAAKAAWERALLARADVVACSSDELAQRCLERGADPVRIVRIPNGWDASAFPVQPSAPLPRTGPLVLGYFGTIAPWLDVAALEAVLQACPEASVRLIGPQDGIALRSTPRLAVEPPWPHAALAAAVADCHAMLLPFRVDALTRGVDPVKLYEYVALGKPILAAHWPALDRFAPFVTFYRDGGELARRVAARDVATPPAAAIRAAFLAPQSWPARAEALHAAIDGVLAAREGVRSRAD